MTNTEKRAAVLRVVEEQEWGFMSNSYIAEKAGVTEGLVRKMKKEFGGTWPNRKKEFEDLMFQIGLAADALAGGGDEQKAMEWAKANLGKFEAERQKYIEIGKACLRSEMKKDMKAMEEVSKDLNTPGKHIGNVVAPSEKQSGNLGAAEPESPA